MKMFLARLATFFLICSLCLGCSKTHISDEIKTNTYKKNEFKQKTIIQYYPINEKIEDHNDGTFVLRISHAFRIIPGNVVPSKPGREKDLRIRELLFRFVFSFNTKEKLWFIDFGDKEDPPKNFLMLFDDINSVFKPVSKAKYNWGVFDSETNGKGAIAKATIIRWIDNQTAEVACEYYIAPLWAGGWIGILRYEDGSWIFDIKEEWVS